MKISSFICIPTKYYFNIHTADQPDGVLDIAASPQLCFIVSIKDFETKDTGKGFAVKNLSSTAFEGS